MKTCPYCTGEIQDDAVKCKHCKSWLNNNTVSQQDGRPVQTEKPKEGCKEYIVLNPLPTTQNKRFLNLLLDIAFQYGFAFIIGIFIVLVAPEIKIDEANDRALGILVAFVYFILFESICGKTLAKFITKTKVVMKDGSKPNFGNICLRTLCRLIPFEAFSFLGSKNPIGWHDKLSSTMVVDDVKTIRIEKS